MDETQHNWRDSEKMSDHDAELSIREHLSEARKLAEKRLWYGITGGIDRVLATLDQE